jgi:kumamolisin
VNFSALAISASLVCACDPPQPLDRVELVTGLPRASSSHYTDLGVTSGDAKLRALIALPIRNSAELDATIDALYDPQSPQFRNYLSTEQWVASYAPAQEDVVAISEWLEAGGLDVARVSRNRLLIEVQGTAADFDDTFFTELHLLAKKDEDTYTTFGTEQPLFAPADIARRIESVVVADEPADTSPLPMETGDIVTEPQASDAFTVDRIAHIYGFDATTARGAGTTIGVVCGAGFKRIDVQSFWRSNGIDRSDPTLIETMEPLSTRFTETTLDIEWSGALAPAAQLLVYAGPDAYETSLAYTFNAAIEDGRAQVITDSFAHREDVTPRAIRNQYHASARMAAALGITVVAASGDSGEPDVPSSSPLVTSVGGTVLLVDAGGSRGQEVAWRNSGSGSSLSFPAPPWQTTAGNRAVSDVALASGPYWTYAFGTWRKYNGTSFSAPVFAAMIAVVNSARATAGKKPVGLINRALYSDAAVQASMYDVVAGNTKDHSAGAGWDFPTGWGAPDAARLIEVLP